MKVERANVMPSEDAITITHYGELQRHQAHTRIVETRPLWVSASLRTRL